MALSILFMLLLCRMRSFKEESVGKGQAVGIACPACTTASLGEAVLRWVTVVVYSTDLVPFADLHSVDLMPRMWLQVAGMQTAAKTCGIAVQSTGKLRIVLRALQPFP